MEAYASSLLPRGVSLTTTGASLTRGDERAELREGGNRAYVGHCSAESSKVRNSHACMAGPPAT